jgi:hypothetical protein
MRFLKSLYLFESNNTNKKDYNSKSLVFEICTSMVLLNNEFLDNILDRGLKARYSENSSVFLTDLKNLLLSKNRLELGKLEVNKFVVDNEVSKINVIFDQVDFDIEKNWEQLVNARNTARSISDKLLADGKLKSDFITNIFWIGPNKNDDCQEDIVIETKDGSQHSFYLNKNMSLQKTASFNTFADDLIPNDIDNLYKEENLRKWDKLTQEWIRIIYENSNKNIQSHIEKFIDTKRIDSIGYFEYFDIRHRDNRFKYLGEYMKEFEKNILKLSDLLNEVWKQRDVFFIDSERATKEWYETKITILNSRILENLFTTSLKREKSDEIDKLESGLKRASGTVKMKLIKAIVNKMNCMERPVYYISNGGSNFVQIPSRSFFRQNYDKLDLQFDYHVKFEVSNEEEENNNFKFRIKIFIDEQELLSMIIVIGFSGGEFSSKLNAKYKYDLPENFNYIVSKINKSEEF